VVLFTAMPFFLPCYFGCKFLQAFLSAVSTDQVRVPHEAAFFCSEGGFIQQNKAQEFNKEGYSTT